MADVVAVNCCVCRVTGCGYYGLGKCLSPEVEIVPVMVDGKVKGTMCATCWMVVGPGGEG